MIYLTSIRKNVTLLLVERKGVTLLLVVRKGMTLLLGCDDFDVGC